MSSERQEGRHVMRVYREALRRLGGRERRVGWVVQAIPMWRWERADQQDLIDEVCVDLGGEG